MAQNDVTSPGMEAYCSPAQDSAEADLAPAQEFSEFVRTMSLAAAESPFPETRGLVKEIEENAGVVGKLSDEVLEKALNELDELESLEDQATRLKKLAFMSELIDPEPSPAPANHHSDPGPSPGGGSPDKPAPSGGSGMSPLVAGLVFVLACLLTQAGLGLFQGIDTVRVRHQVLGSTAAARALDSPGSAQCLGQCELLCDAPLGSPFSSLSNLRGSQWQQAEAAMRTDLSSGAPHRAAATLYSVDLLSCPDQTGLGCVVKQRVFPDTHLRSIQNGGGSTREWHSRAALEARWVAPEEPEAADCSHKCAAMCN